MTDTTITPASEDPALDGGARPSRFDYRWVAMGVVLFGTFMVVLDTTVVNLGLPSLQDDFHTIDGVEWVVTAYLAAVGVAQMVSGWLSDRVGRRISFIGALATFTVGSILCALAPSLQLLVAARVLQGFGGGVLMPVAMAMIYELFEPEERGRALGYFGIAIMAAPAIGPVLGGGLVESVGWRWLFLINVPIGLVGIPVAVRLLRDTGFREERPFDQRGLALSGAGVIALLVGFSRGGTHGWTSPVALLLVAAGIVLLTAFTRHALRVRAPLVQMRILANPTFAIAMVALALLAVAQYARLVYIPLELGSLRDVSAFQIGLVMLPSALGIAVTMPIGGRLTDRIGARIPVSVGVALLAASFWPLAHLRYDTPLPTISALLFLGGLGSGLAMMAPNIVAMNATESRFVSQASGLSSVTRQLSAAVGTSILAAIYATLRPTGAASTISRTAAVGAYNDVFLIGFLILVAALVAAQWLPGKIAALALQEARRAEATGTIDGAEAESLLSAATMEL